MTCLIPIGLSGAGLKLHTSLLGTFFVYTLGLKAISRKFTPIWGVNHKIAFNKKLFDSIQTFRH